MEEKDVGEKVNRSIPRQMGFILAVVLAGILGLAACDLQVETGSGESVTETREVSGFDRVSICCGMNLILTQGSEEALEIEADENILADIETTVSGETLRVDLDEGFLEFFERLGEPVNLYLTMREIHGVEISGGGSLQAGQIETDSLEIEISGGGEASIDDLAAEALRLEISGGGEAEVAGRAASQDVAISGGGDYDASSLESEQVEIEMSGGGEAVVWANDALTAELSGGGTLEYYGDPQVAQQVSGGGDIIPLGEH